MLKNFEIHWIVFSIALVLAGATAAAHRLFPNFVQQTQSLWLRFSNRRWLCIVAAALLPVAIRLAVLPWWPAPTPYLADEFGHLLVADTLLQGRLANPEHPLAGHFESAYIQQTPTFASVYPLGQGAMLAAGKLLFGHPFGGVMLAVALMCGALTWALYGILPKHWSAAGGLMFAIQLGLVRYWADSYWGGATCAFGGCLLFGSLVRLRAPSVWLAAAAGAGWSIVWLVRPFESLLLLATTAAVFAWRAKGWGQWRPWIAPAAALILPMAATGVLTLAHNRAVTGSPLLLPYMLAQQQYGVPQGLIWQAPIERPALPTPELVALYNWQRSVAGTGYLPRIWRAITTIHESFLGWLALPFLLALLSWRNRRVQYAALLLAAMVLVSGLYPFVFAHYLAAYTTLFAFLVATGMQRLLGIQFHGWPLGRIATVFIATVVLGTRLLVPTEYLADPGKYQPSLRARLLKLLEEKPGRDVVFVTYVKDHYWEIDWVYNDADIDNANVIWARNLGPEANQRFLQRYPDRKFWAVDVAKNSIQMLPYHPGQPDQPAPTKAPESGKPLAPSSAALKPATSGN